MSTRPYTKQALTFAQQVALLQQRGLAIQDPAEAEKALARINYYRLSAYWHPFKQPDDSFRPGASFDVALKLYEYDRRLRLHVLNAIERVEVQLRTAMAYQFGHRLGPFGYENPANFLPSFNHARWMQDLAGEAHRSLEKFVDHYQSTYIGFPSMPIWMATELMTLGTLSYLFRNGITLLDRSQIAKSFGVQHDVFGSWLHSLTYVRNTCAHHSRLWNRELGIKPRLPKQASEWRAPLVLRNDRIYSTLLILRFLTNTHHAADDWAEGTKALLAEMDTEPLWLTVMGVPADWRKHPFWPP